MGKLFHSHGTMPAEILPPGSYYFYIIKCPLLQWKYTRFILSTCLIMLSFVRKKVSYRIIEIILPIPIESPTMSKIFITIERMPKKS